METHKVVSAISWFADKLGTFMQGARITTSVVAAGVRISDEVGVIGLAVANDRVSKGARGMEVLASASFITLDVLRVATNLEELKEWRKERGETKPYYKNFEEQARERLAQHRYKTVDLWLKDECVALAEEANRAHTSRLLKYRLGLATFGSILRGIANTSDPSNPRIGPARLGGRAQMAYVSLGEIGSLPLPLVIELCELAQTYARREQSLNPKYNAVVDRRWLALDPGMTLNSVIIALNVKDIAHRCAHHEMGRLIRLYPQRQAERRQEQITQIAGSSHQASSALTRAREEIERIQGRLDQGELLSAADEERLRTLISLTQ